MVPTGLRPQIHNIRASQPNQPIAYMLCLPDRHQCLLMSGCSMLSWSELQIFFSTHSNIWEFLYAYTSAFPAALLLRSPTRERLNPKKRLPSSIRPWCQK
ncbi:hypothetical protein SCLCIDRAFT_377010 [Scleroderma citrinum Foug A]|uniref:Uncharacterized protein n=1 Tax=Scleroderma citrinum Foug A TaxID=1036808 RepID=A0A0C3D0W4_9AGAM|nr:hypothetical protein SCLCIDRAFT_377010 [Scleroderma citrinum Foug A]